MRGGYIEGILELAEQFYQEKKGFSVRGSFRSLHFSTDFSKKIDSYYIFIKNKAQLFFLFE